MNIVVTTDRVVDAVVAVLAPGDFDTVVLRSGATIATTALVLDGVPVAVRGLGLFQSFFLDGLVYGEIGLELEGASASVFLGATASVNGRTRAVVFDGGGAVLDTAGRIAGAFGVSAAADLRMINTGSITARQGAVAASGTLDLTNLGTIAGDIAVSASNLADTVTNAGTIIGSVRLGDGADLFDTRDGRVSGRIDLGAGDDTMLGGAGNDTVTDSAGADAVSGGAGDDVVIASADGASDTLDGGDGEDLLNFALLAQGVRVALDAGIARGAEIGTDLIAGFEHVTGSAGSDRIVGDAPANHLRGGAGDDTVEGGNGNDRLWGGDGANRLDGGAGNDRLTGGDALDTLFGGTGNDIIVGGFDIDLMGGGTGSDVFVWRDIGELFSVAGTGTDRITDFTPGADVIDLSAMDWDAPGSAFTFRGAAGIDAPGQVAIRVARGNTFVDISFFAAGIAGSIRLDGTPALTDADFIL